MTENVTPRPWKLHHVKRSIGIDGADGTWIMNDVLHRASTSNTEDLNYNVHCVNMHEQLVEMLQGLVQVRNRTGGADTDGHGWENSRAVLAQRLAGPRGDSDESA